MTQNGHYIFHFFFLFLSLSLAFSRFCLFFPSFCVLARMLPTTLRTAILVVQNGKVSRIFIFCRGGNYEYIWTG